jgi:hypothetical protein
MTKSEKLQDSCVRYINYFICGETRDVLAHPVVCRLNDRRVQFHGLNLFVLVF